MSDRFAKIVFRSAAVYGVVIMVPLYFAPWSVPPETHLGFVGVTLVFQAVFWWIGGDPGRYRAIMPLAVAEKLVFAVPALVLIALGRTQAIVGMFAIADLVLAALFFRAWQRTACNDA